MSIRVRITGADDLMRKLSPAVLDRPIRRFLNASGMVLTNELKAHVKVDTGTARRSMHYEVERRRVVAGTNLPYVAVLARGRRPGAKMPPPGSLKGWMRRHGMDPSKEYLVARKIGRTGIKGDDFDKKAVAAAIPQIEQLLPVLARDIESAMRAA